MQPYDLAIPILPSRSVSATTGFYSKRLSSPCWRQRRWRRSEVGRRQSVPVCKPSVERWPERLSSWLA
jgi:hypothetical protein